MGRSEGGFVGAGAGVGAGAKVGALEDVARRMASHAATLEGEEPGVGGRL